MQNTITILKHGLSWIYCYASVLCPECSSEKEFITFEVYENQRTYTVECECVECNCKWTVSRRDEGEEDSFPVPAEKVEEVLDPITEGEST